MKVKEVFESMDIVRDDKARRRLNVADDIVPNIDIQTLSNGVTIEQLEQLNVPVLQYKTQITIHGKFALGNVGLPAGLVWNENQSLGIRYVLIDYEKKLKLKEIACLSQSAWKVSINSQECTVWQRFNAKQDAIDCYNSINTDFIGRKDAISLVYYGYAVIVTINAIYQKDFWNFCQEFFNMTESKIKELKNAREQQRIIEQAAYEKARVERTKQVEILKEQIKGMGYDLYSGKIKSGFYLQVGIAGDMVVRHLKVTPKRITVHGKRISSADEIGVFDYSNMKGKFIDPKNIKGWYLIQLDTQEKLSVVQPVAKSNNSTSIGFHVKYSGTWTWVHFLNGVIPSESKRCEMKRMGGRYSPKRKAWYFTSIVPEEQLEFLKS